MGQVGIGYYADGNSLYKKKYFKKSQAGVSLDSDTIVERTLSWQDKSTFPPNFILIERAI
jgi:hypothetical protein